MEALCRSNRPDASWASIFSFQINISRALLALYWNSEFLGREKTIAKFKLTVSLGVGGSSFFSCVHLLSAWRWFRFFFLLFLFFFFLLLLNVIFFSIILTTFSFLFQNYVDACVKNNFEKRKFIILSFEI